MRTVTAVPSVTLRALSTHAIDEEQLVDLIYSFQRINLAFAGGPSVALGESRTKVAPPFRIRQRPGAARLCASLTCCRELNYGNLLSSEKRARESHRAVLISLCKTHIFCGRLIEEELIV